MNLSSFVSTWWQSWAGPYSILFRRRIFLAPPLLPEEPPELRSFLKTAVFLPKDGKPKAIVFYCHDAHHDVDHLVADLQELAAAGQVTVVAWEYPGYGHMRRPHSSPLDDEDTTTYASIGASPTLLKTEVLDVFDNVCKSSTLPLILFGTGYGNGFVMHIASQRKLAVKAIIMYRPFASLSAITRQWFAFPRWLAYPWWWLEPNVLDNIACANAMDKFKGPVTLIHGKKDHVFPLIQVHELANALKQYGNDRVHLVTHPKWDHSVPLKQVLEEEVVPALKKMFS